MCPGVHILDDAFRARDCYVDALDAASWAQCVRLWLPVMILSKIIVRVLVPESVFMSMCCNFHALMLLPGLCCMAVDDPDAAASAAYGIAHIREATSIVCHNDHAPVANSGAGRVVTLMPLMRLPALRGCM